MSESTSNTAKPERVSVRMSKDEAWEYLTNAHTGIFTTLRRDGFPISLPVWFVVLDGAIYVRTPNNAKKVGRIRHDQRVGFLVEEGIKWAELKAVHVTGRAEEVDDEALIEQIQQALGAKYGKYRTESKAMPSATRQHYARPFVMHRIVPDERVLNWDNTRLGLS